VLSKVINNFTSKIKFIESSSFKTPVLFLIFNRPNVTQRVFSAIKKVRPTQLYVAADGPRSNPGEKERCNKTRNILEKVDWDCEVKTLFREENLGCRLAVSSAIDWFFEEETEGIILEDDCLPNQSFFWYCQELLEHFRNDTRIMHIGGTNFQFGNYPTNDSYYFSRYAHVWGWASWRRAWKFYDEKMEQCPVENYNEILLHFADNQSFNNYWYKVFQQTSNGETNTWDYQWTFACWNQKGLSVIPSVNLVSNLGFSADSTHTSKPSPLANMLTETINLPLKHPNQVVRHQKADTYVECQQFSRPILSRILQIIYRLMGWRKK